MKNILVVDTQNKFVDEGDLKLILDINSYIKNNNFNVVVYTKLVTNVDNIGNNFTKDYALLTKNDVQLAVKKIQKGRVFCKKSHGITHKLIKYLFANHVDEIEICGVDNNDDFELIKNQLEGYHIKTEINKKLTKNTDLRAFINKNDCFSTINGFYIGDMLANNLKITSTTILSFALIEWLNGYQKSAEQFQKNLCYYYKLFPNKNYNYSTEMAKWMESGCRYYRICYDYFEINYCTPIGLYANSLSEINTLLQNTIIVTHNNEESLFIAKVITYAIYLLKTNTEKRCLINKLQKILNFQFDLNLENNIEKFNKNKENIVFLEIILAIFINTNNYYEAIAQAIKIDEKIVSVVCVLCDIYYKDISMSIVNEFKEKLPQKFINLINIFAKSTTENSA